MKRLTLLRRVLTLTGLAASLALSLCGPVSAQYQWRDNAGQMVYSDRAPPTSIRPDQIIRVPEVRKTLASETRTSAAGQPGSAPGGPSLQKTAAVAGSAASTSTPQSNADREMAYQKRLADRAEAEQKALADKVKKEQLARACNDARSDARLYESGQRVSRVNQQGEREFMPDKERSERLSAVRKTLSERC